jgi:3-phosphoshikimate 1-carboxyvinyltransferase
VIITPGAPLTGQPIAVPGDISSAAFFLVAAAIVRDGRVTIRNVGVNPTRTGILDVLAAMDARVRDTAQPAGAGEPASDLAVTSGRLIGAEIGGALIPRLIDEVPVLAVAACLADGVTRIRDAAELRVKESDRIRTVATELGKMGARITEQADGLEIQGGARLTGARVRSGGDHRMAMALAVAGLVADGPTLIEDSDCIATSFPGFADLLNRLAGGAPVAVVS